MKWIALFLALLATPAVAQNVRQSGGVTPTHAAAWTTNGIIQDAGTAAAGFLTTLGVTANGPGICQNSGPVSGPYNQVCLGATPTGGTISLTNYNGATGGMQILQNGSPIIVPTTTIAAGSGIVFTGTNPTIISLGTISFNAGSYSTLITNNGAVTATNGIALDTVTFTNNAITTPGFTVDKTGNIFTSQVLSCSQLTTNNQGKIQCGGGGAGNITISNFPSFSIFPTTGFAYTGPANGLNLPLNSGSPFLVYDQITSAAADVAYAGVSHVSKYVAYSLAPLTGVHPAFSVETSVQNPVNNFQAGIYTAAANYNITTAPPGEADVLGLISIATCVVNNCTEVQGAAISAYDISGQANPTQQLIGLEVDTNAHGTDNNFKRIGILVASNTADGIGTANEVTSGISFFGAGTATGQGYFGNLISATGATTLNGINLNGTTFLTGGNAFLSPGFAVDASGNIFTSPVPSCPQLSTSAAGKIQCSSGTSTKVCNVLALGAVGNGSTDNYPILAPAWNSTCPILYFPAGTYNFSNTLVGPATSGSGIICDDPGSTSLVGTNTSNEVVLLHTSTVGYRIKGCTITHTPASTTACGLDTNTVQSEAILSDLHLTNNGNGLCLQNVDFGVIEDVIAENNVNGILMSTGTALQWDIRNVLVQNNSNDGILASGNGTSTTMGNWSGITAFANAAGIVLNGVVGARIVNSFVGTSITNDIVILNGTNTNYPTNFTNVYTELSGGSGWDKAASDTAPFVCNQCVAVGQAADGIFIGNGDAFIIGGVFMGNRANGVQASAGNITLLGNQALNNTTKDFNLASANCVVLGNRFVNITNTCSASYLPAGSNY